jgi:hypothetical protein
MAEMTTNLRSEASDPYGVLRDRVMIYAGPNAHVVESGLYAEEDGVVLHGAGGAQLARHLKDAGFEGPVLWDPERYQPGQSPVSEGLFNENDEAAVNQKLLGVDAFLSPSILPPSNDSDAIRKLLHEGYRFLETARTVDASMPGFVVLPLTPRC